MSTNIKVVRVDNEIRVYKCDNDIISYYVISRSDMTRLTDIGIFIKILPYNSVVVREIAGQWFNYTK